MAKIEKTSNKTTAFAGNFYVHKLFTKSGCYHLVNEELGDRKSTKIIHTLTSSATFSTFSSAAGSATRTYIGCTEDDNGGSNFTQIDHAMN